MDQSLHKSLLPNCQRASLRGALRRDDKGVALGLFVSDLDSRLGRENKYRARLEHVNGSRKVSSKNFSGSPSKTMSCRSGSQPWVNPQNADKLSPSPWLLLVSEGKEQEARARWIAVEPSPPAHMPLGVGTKQQHTNARQGCRPQGRDPSRVARYPSIWGKRDPHLGNPRRPGRQPGDAR